ncbi:MAG: rod shape-determining protein [Bacillota bacterium]
MLGFTPDIGIDLGTATVLVYVKGKGIVLNEPSVVAINRDDNRVISVGEDARRMLGRTPGNIIAVRPLKEGVIADYDVTEKMLRYFIMKCGCRRFLLRPRVIVCIPTGVTSVEERAVRQAAIQAGARQSFLIEEPMAAALGAGLDVAEANGSMVIDIGGGTTDIAVLSLGGIVCSTSTRVGGDKFDEAIVRYVRREFNMIIGDRSAEELKIEIGTAVPSSTIKRSGSIRGRDLVSGLPRSVTVNSQQVWEAIREPLDNIVTALKSILEWTPPELAADIVDKGIVMTGGGSLLEGIDTLLSKETGLPVYVAEDPVSCVALGTGRALGMLNVLSRSRHARALRVV